MVSAVRFLFSFSLFVCLVGWLVSGHLKLVHLYLRIIKTAIW